MTNAFTAFAFPATGGSANVTLPDRLSIVSDVKDFGALGDGSGAFLNTRYASLAAAQVDYPFVTNIATQSIDWAAITAAIGNNSVALTATASNQTASFTGAIASATFTGTISGNTLTTSGPTGTIAIGQTISPPGGSGFTPCQIVSGSGSSWVVNGSPQTVGPVAMATNCVLAVSSVSGNTIAFNSTNLVAGSGVNASFIASQFNGTAGGNGIYVLDRPQNVTSQAMISISCILTFASVPAGHAPLFGGTITGGMYGIDLAASASLAGASVISASSTTVTMNFTAGLVSIGDVIIFYRTNRGTIYFPPGTYVASEPISFFSDVSDKVNGILSGEMALSTITGNFADYVFSQNDSANANLTVIEKLNIINTNAAGGGIRMGGAVGGAIRDCTITANKGINTFTTDAPVYFGSLEVSIENCILSPGSNVTNSQGIMSISDGPIINCRITGYATGLQLAGGQHAQHISGCHFEQCGTAFLPGIGPGGLSDSAGPYTMTGCSFKNNSIAIDFQASTGSSLFAGIQIEGATGQAPGGTNPQYGIRDGNGGTGDLVGSTLFAGITVTGNYDVAGIYIFGHTFQGNTTWMGASSVSWTFDTISASNPVMPTVVNSSGTGLPYIYKVAALPGANVGDCYNVSDGTNALAWGAPVTNTGIHTTHYKTRWNGSNYTVVGQ